MGGAAGGKFRAYLQEDAIKRLCRRRVLQERIWNFEDLFYPFLMLFFQKTHITWKIASEEDSQKYF